MSLRFCNKGNLTLNARRWYFVSDCKNAMNSQKALWLPLATDHPCIIHTYCFIDLLDVLKVSFLDEEYSSLGWWRNDESIIYYIIYFINNKLLHCKSKPLKNIQWLRWDSNPRPSWVRVSPKPLNFFQWLGFAVYWAIYYLFNIAWGWF